MQSPWREKQVQQALNGTLLFTAEQAKRMRAEARTRMESQTRSVTGRNLLSHFAGLATLINKVLDVQKGLSHEFELGHLANGIQLLIVVLLLFVPIRVSAQNVETVDCTGATPGTYTSIQAAVRRSGAGSRGGAYYTMHRCEREAAHGASDWNCNEDLPESSGCRDSDSPLVSFEC